MNPERKRRAKQPVASPWSADLARIEVRTRSMTIDGIETAMWEYGPENAAKTLLFVHGFRGDHHGLEQIVANLPDFRILIPDLPGFGATPAPADRELAMKTYISWLTALLAEIGDIDLLLGHSFGSIVCAAGVAAGIRVPRMVLVNPIAAPALSGPRAIATKGAIAYYRVGAALPGRLGYALLRSRIITRITSLAMVKTRVPALRRFIHDQHDRYFGSFADSRSVLEAFRTSVTHDVSEYAVSIRVPTLLIAAERDDISSLDQVSALLERIPSASMVVIPSVGHLVHYETPDIAASAIRDFLAVHREEGAGPRGERA